MCFIFCQHIYNYSTERGYAYMANIDIQVNTQLIVLLLLLGAAVKHLKVFEKINNDLIPIMCYVVAIIVEFASCYPVKPSDIINILIIAFASATSAIGIHQTGKNIFVNGVFTNMIVKSITPTIKDSVVSDINKVTITDTINGKSDTYDVKDNEEDKSEG